MYSANEDGLISVELATAITTRVAVRELLIAFKGIEFLAEVPKENWQDYKNSIDKNIAYIDNIKSHRVFLYEVKPILDRKADGLNPVQDKMQAKLLLRAILNKLNEVNPE